MLTKQDLVSIGQVIELKLNPIKKDLKRIEKKVDYMVDFLDREILKDRKRIEKLEEKTQQKNYI
jgi:hypothetical protein